MSHDNFIISEKIWKITYFYDARSEKRADIEEFLKSEKIAKIENFIDEDIFLSLGGDGMFVYVAKLAHKNNNKILGINFGNLWFLVQDLENFCNDFDGFEVRKYPILRAILKTESWKKIIWNAFNEVYLTRSGDASSAEFEISHLGKTVNFRGDGLMVSTPSGSTGWSKSYSGIILPHNANLNILTPIGTISPINFKSLVLANKGRIIVKNQSRRQNPLEILLDNKQFVRDLSENFELIIEQDPHYVQVLIAKNFIKKFDAKVYEIQWMNFNF